MLADSLVDATAVLRDAQRDARDAGSTHAEAKAFARSVIPAQEALRTVVDELETLVADDLVAATQVSRAAVPVLRD